MTLQMTIINTCNSLHNILYNFTVYKCDPLSLYVTICLLLSAVYKLVHSVNLTSKLSPVCLVK